MENLAKGARVTLSTLCDGICKATVKVPALMVEVGREVAGTITYRDSTAKRNSTAATHSVTATSAVATPGRATCKSAAFRCDKEIGTTAGCVFPAAAPTLTSMSQLPGNAANIRRVMDAGPHHYGDQTRGNPLTRTTDAALERANRNTACPASRKRPQGQSCDEYPFARTNQGASKSDRRDWAWAWVPISEENSQGGYLSAFYKAQRVLNGDKFWVEVP
ncbi:NucA/NucB deoxyribonuclease domain-containing protein [Streptomyces sp. NPDC058746]|uniref:NucA/NucB deoxyribonuclease domain-containing protein n=1 Tax=Streptomyces sp. NPDC058746 TaxID=3346622 RepID=UPI0036C88AB9